MVAAQATFAELDYGAMMTEARRERFLERMERLMPWKELKDVIRPHYPKTWRAGRRTHSLSAMLRVHCVQLFYNLSDPGMERMLNEVESVRRFAGLRLEALPDETTILKFRRLLEEHCLGEKLMAAINASRSACVSDAPKLLRVDDLLHSRAEAVLRQRLAADPRDAEALRRLGDVHRRKGNFPAAAEAYGRLKVLRPADRQASWLRAVTAGEQLPAAPPDGLRAAPFVHIRDFLSHAERARLLSAAFATQGLFTPGGVGRGADRKVRPLERQALALRLPGQGGVRAWLVPKLREALPMVSMLLRVDSHDLCRMGLTMVVHPDGGFGVRHRDGAPLAAICYFHRDPRPFSGGDLLLHDTDVETGRSSASEFSRVVPLGGSVVFYPSYYAHEIAAVGSVPGGPGEGDFAAARLSVAVAFEPEAE